MTVELWQGLGTAVGLVLSLFVFSYLLGDNWLYRLAIYVFIGLTAAFTLIVTVESLLPYGAAFVRLITGGATDIDTFPALSFIVALILIIPVLIGRLPGRGVTLGLLIAVGSAVAVLGTLTGTLLPFTLSTGRAVGDGVHGGNIFNGIILLLGVVTSLLYFQFQGRRTPEGVTERGPWSQAISGIGQVFIVLTLGALYGTAILTSLTILTARISVLVRGA
jgi:hypothetical protein